jgi:hypothetical protein
VSFVAIALCAASVVYFVIDSVRKLLDTPSYMNGTPSVCAVQTLRNIAPKLSTEASDNADLQ